MREPSPGFMRFFHIWVRLVPGMTMNEERKAHSIRIQPRQGRKICNENAHAACAAEPIATCRFVRSNPYPLLGVFT